VTDDLPKLELQGVFQADAAELAAAREKARLVHATKDIRASGDEVEVAARAVLSRKLPGLYYVGHGHIVDARLRTSPQLDVIVADNQQGPVLFRGQGGAEYFPFETVFAVGEVKSSYDPSKEPVREFMQKLQKIRSGLHREPTPKLYIGSGVTLGEGFSLSDPKPYKNPLFAFALFVDGDRFDPAALQPLYSSTKVPELPNVVCILNKGILLNAVIDQPDGYTKLGPVNLVPEFNEALGITGARWVFVPFGEEDFRIGASFAFLYFAIVTHLRSVLLMQPNLHTYMEGFFPHKMGVVIA